MDIVPGKNMVMIFLLERFYAKLHNLESRLHDRGISIACLSRLKDNEAIIRNLMASRHSTPDIFDYNRDLVEELEGMVRHLEEEVGRLMGDDEWAITRKKDIEAYRNKINKEDLERTIRSREGFLKELQEYLTEMHSVFIEQTEELLKSLADKLKKNQEAIADAQRRIQELQAQAENLQKQLDAVENSMAADLAAISGIIVAAQQMHGMVLGNLSAADQTTLQNSIDILQAGPQQGESLESYYQRTVAAAQDFVMIAPVAQQQYDVLITAAQGDRARYAETVDGEEQILVGHNTELVAVNDSLLRHDTEADRMRQERDGLTKEISLLKSGTRDAAGEERLKVSEARAVELDAALDRHSALGDQLRQKRDSLVEKIHSAEEKIKEANEKIAGIDAALAELAVKQEAIQESIIECTKRLKKVEGTNAERKQIEAENVRVKGEIKKAEVELGKLKDKQRSLELDMKGHEVALDDFEQEHENLTTELRETSQSLSQTQTLDENSQHLQSRQKDSPKTPREEEEASPGPSLSPNLS